MQLQRREFLTFLGRGVAVTTAFQLGVLPSFAQEMQALGYTGFSPIRPSDEDRLVLANGFHAEILISWNDKINFRGEKFGFNNDFIGFIPDAKNKDEAYLFVNHESPNPLFLHKGQSKKNKDDIVIEQKSVGASILKIRKYNGNWSVVKNHAINRRLDGTTPIPFSGNAVIGGSSQAIGTFANCGGGVTPWGHFLTCEENYDQYYGEVVGGKLTETACLYDWQKHFRRPPQHYGWVVEVNPVTAAAKKLVSLGRFAHEASLVVKASDGRPVVYMGDDTNDQFIYKFVSSKVDSLESGNLFVANTEKGQWLLLDRENNDTLKKTFKSHEDLMVHAREGAKLLGATPQDRPEDIERDPLTGTIIVALTNNKPKNRPHGSLLKILEKDNNPLSMEFESSTFKMGGESSGFSCPDNLAFDRNGNLWIAVDMAGTEMHKDVYTKFKNNGLFVIPAQGKRAGEVLQVASAPRDAELTGICFSDDYQTLFVSVQHPGETTKDYAHPTSQWPNRHLPGDGKVPRPGVVAIRGPGLRSFTDIS